MGHIPDDARWYIADLVFEHTIVDDPRNVVHVNIHLIEANSPEQAYQKAVKLGQAGEQSYINTDDKKVQITFRGLRDLGVIHDDLEDGAELLYEEAVGLTEDNLLRWIKPKDALSVFAPRRARLNVPNYMPKEVMEMLEQEGFQRDEILGNSDEA